MPKKIKTIIIEDEPFAAEDLREMLKNHPEIVIIGEAGSVGRARELLKTVTPDLVFLDIQLRGGSGFDLVPDIPTSGDIIFFTSHDRFAVRAFEINALDYLLKPVTEDRLAAAISRVTQKGQSPHHAPGPAEPAAETDRIYIHTDKERRFVAVSAVVAVTSEGGNYTAVNLEDGNRPLVRKTLKEWGNSLPQPMFFRVHRSAIVNTRRLCAVEKRPNGRFVAGFAGMEAPVEIARRHVSHLKKLLENRAPALGG